MRLWELIKLLDLTKVVNIIGNDARCCVLFELLYMDINITTMPMNNDNVMSRESFKKA